MNKLNPFEKEREIHRILLRFLINNPKGMTTTELSKRTGISRKTIEKHLQILVFENEIYMKQFGPTRMYYPNHRVHHIDFEKMELNENQTIWFDILENEYGFFLLIQEKRREGDQWLNRGSLTVPLNSLKEFAETLDKIRSNKKIRKLKKTNTKKRFSFPLFSICF
jgi:predicted ArsR family transcriptional regulator